MGNPPRTPMCRRRKLAGLAATVAVAILALAMAAPAGAADRKLLSEFQDDRVLTHEGPQRLRSALDNLQLLGVDYIRTVVDWYRVAPAKLETQVPQGLDLSDPRSYAPADWDPFDRLVREATARGIKIHMNPAGHTPNWASGCGNNLYRACLPSPTLFSQFVTAVGRRYDGTYVDENEGNQVLPRVGAWSLWNEPNINSWINPQTVGSGRKQRRTAAKIYRSLFFAGYDALGATGHGKDLILLGETAPIGAPPKRTSPVQFYRDLFCLDLRGRKLKGDAAKKLGCVKPRPFKVSGVSHHPYVKGAGPPLPAKLLEGAASVGTMDGLKRVLDQAARRKMIRRKVPIYITEFGISTDPPDEKYGTPLEKAAASLNQAERYHWLDKRIRMVSQFEYEDDINITTFKTGLRYGDTGLAKPSWHAYRLPVFVLPDRKDKKRVIVWGWARAAKNQRQQVVIQIRRTTFGEWENVRTVTTEKYGFFNVSTKMLKGSWRLVWVHPTTGEFVFSRVARVDNFNKAPSPGFSPPGSSGGTGGVDPGTGGGTGGGGTGGGDGGTGGGTGDGGTGGGDGGTGGGTGGGDGGTGGGTGGGGTGGGGTGGGGTPPPPPPPSYGLTVDFQRLTFAGLPPALAPAGTGEVRFNPARTFCEQTCTRTFTQGTNVILTAVPTNGSTFEGWAGACSGTSTQCTVPMSQARQVTATFRGGPTP